MSCTLGFDPGSISAGAAVVDWPARGGAGPRLLYSMRLHVTTSWGLERRLAALPVQMQGAALAGLQHGATRLALEEPPPVWRTASGRERNQNAAHVLGLCNGLMLGAWLAAGGPPEVLLVPVSLWRRALAHLGPAGSWGSGPAAKRASVAAARTLLGAEFQADVAEAALLAAACGTLWPERRAVDKITRDG